MIVDFYLLCTSSIETWLWKYIHQHDTLDFPWFFKKKKFTMMWACFFSIYYDFFFCSVFSINFQLLLFKSQLVECGLFITKILTEFERQMGQMQCFKLTENNKGSTRTVWIKQFVHFIIVYFLSFFFIGSVQIETQL